MVVVASTADAKWLMGREEARAVTVPSEIVMEAAGEAVAAAGISKTARHRGHLKGVWPISKRKSKEVRKEREEREEIIQVKRKESVKKMGGADSLKAIGQGRQGRLNADRAGF